MPQYPLYHTRDDFTCAQFQYSSPAIAMETGAANLSYGGYQEFDDAESSSYDYFYPFANDYTDCPDLVWSASEQRLESSSNIQCPEVCSNRSTPSPANSPRTTISEIEERYQRRRKQNRAAQRAYRDRKAQYQSDLERELQEAKHKVSQLRDNNTNLLKELCKAKNEITGLRRAINHVDLLKQSLG